MPAKVKRRSVMNHLYSMPGVQAHEGAVLTARFSKAADLIASGGTDKQVHLWEANLLQGSRPK